MLGWLNEKINTLQPDFVRPEDLELLPVDGYVPKLSDIVIPSIIMAVILVVLRYALDIFVVEPIGIYFDIYCKPVKQTKLETYYQTWKHNSPSTQELTTVAKKVDMTTRQIEIWLRKRRKQDKASDLQRLQDASWQFLFYLVMSWYGIYVLWDKPWFTKSEHVWTGWPSQQTVSNDIYWYYLIELAFYISSAYMLFTDHKRKDFKEMFIHHVVTILLLALSWNYNAVRIGSLVLCVHDPVDYIMGLAKIACYIKYHKISEGSFVLFFLLWIVTRLIIYPYMMLYSALIELPEYASKHGPHEQFYASSFVMRLLQGMLLVLQILHIFWTVMIIKTAATKFTGGTLQDARSDIEDSEEEENASKMNGKT